MTGVTAGGDGVAQPNSMSILPPQLADMHGWKLPLRFEIEGGRFEYSGETIGISPKHFIMVTVAKLRLGSRLRVQIRVPAELSGSAFSEVEIAGWVISGSEMADAKFGYQVEIDQC